MSATLRFLAASLLAATLAACGSAGSEAIKGQSPKTLKSQLEPGMTKSEVTARFGDPLSVVWSKEGDEIWVYSYSEAQADAATFIPLVGPFVGTTTVDTNTLQIWFDRDGRVETYQAGNSTAEF